MAKAGAKLNKSVPRPGQRLGVKIYGGETVNSGNIIIRQVGSSLHSGEGTRMGKDFTIYAVKQGKVNFRKLNGKNYLEVI